MNGRTNLQETTALLLTKMEVKEESQMKNSCKQPGYIGLHLSPEYISIITCVTVVEISINVKIFQSPAEM